LRPHCRGSNGEGIRSGWAVRVHHPAAEPPVGAAAGGEIRSRPVGCRHPAAHGRGGVCNRDTRGGAPGRIAVSRSGHPAPGPEVRGNSPCNASADCARAGFFPAPGQMGSQRRRASAAVGWRPVTFIYSLQNLTRKRQRDVRRGQRGRRWSGAAPGSVGRTRLCDYARGPLKARRKDELRSSRRSRRRAPTACPPGPRST
jgi:hypothetical protein